MPKRLQQLYKTEKYKNYYFWKEDLCNNRQLVEKGIRSLLPLKAKNSHKKYLLHLPTSQGPPKMQKGISVS